MNIETCVETGVDHGSIMDVRADNVSQWIGARTLEEEAAPDCTLDLIMGMCGLPI